MDMEKAREEAVQRITARYVAEVRAGGSPRLGDYLARYPQYTDAITEFVIYFHTIEGALLKEDEVLSLADNIQPLSESSRMALKQAWERLSQSEKALNEGPMTALRIAANRGLSFSEIASKMGLSEDIVEKLEQRRIDASTIPQEVLKRLANILEQQLDIIKMYFGLAGRTPLGAVAESSASYKIEDYEASETQKQSFREAVEQSVKLAAVEKDMWREILAKEGL